ncbi:SprT-like domain-containing protein [Maritalea sp.]|uniref:SprT-like domain-containing protein n=1 Tax=Maritalea sp. TaxID=2003361 RepID=UPI003EFAB3F2
MKPQVQAEESDLVVRSNRHVSSIVRRIKTDSKNEKSIRPTLEAPSELLFACDFFNDALFDGKLPDCVITYTRKKNVLGHFYPDRFERADGGFWPELSLNPTYLALREQRDSLSTLVHELAHVARHYFGPPNRRGGRGSNGYHDLVWASIMEEIGLMPSNTGLPGGKKTGNRMTHYIVDGGPFDVACQALLDSGFRINWHDRLVFSSVDPKGGLDGDLVSPAKKDRIKFTCPKCTLKAWAKPSALLTCTDCSTPMRSAQSSTTNLIKVL